MQHKGRQPRAIDRQRQRGVGGVHRAKGPALIKHRGQRHGDGDQCCGGRQGQRQREFCAAVKAFAAAGLVACAQTARQIGQQNRANGDAHNPQRQLIKPIGIDQPRHRAFGIGCHLPADQQVDLHHPPGQDRRGGDIGQTLEFRRDLWPARGKAEAQLARRNPGKAKLCDACHRNGPGQRHAHIPAGLAGQQHGGDKDQVHQHRHETGFGKMAMRVQHT